MEKSSPFFSVISGILGFLFSSDTGKITLYRGCLCAGYDGLNTFLTANSPSIFALHRAISLDRVASISDHLASESLEGRTKLPPPPPPLLGSFGTHPQVKLNIKKKDGGPFDQFRSIRSHGNKRDWYPTN